MQDVATKKIAVSTDHPVVRAGGTLLVMLAAAYGGLVLAGLHEDAPLEVRTGAERIEVASARP